MTRTHFITSFVARLSEKQAVEAQGGKISATPRGKPRGGPFMSLEEVPQRSKDLRGWPTVVRRGYFAHERENCLLCSQPQ